MLVVVSVSFFAYVIRKIRKSQLQIEHAIFWAGIAIVFIIMSVFPELVYGMTRLFGMQAPVNFVFLVMIFLLLLRTFIMSLRMAQLEEKIKNLAQQVAIKNNEMEKKIDGEKELSGKGIPHFDKL